MVTLADTNFRYQNRQLGFLYDRMMIVRNEMLELERLFGIKHELTVAKSQELDLMINEYMYLELERS